MPSAAASWRKQLDARLPPLGSRFYVSATTYGFRGERNTVWVGFSRGFSRFLLQQISFHHFSTLISFIHFISNVRRGLPASYSQTLQKRASSHFILRSGILSGRSTTWGYPLSAKRYLSVIPALIGCNATFMKFVYCTCFCNSLKQKKKSLKYESFDLPSVFMRMFAAAWQMGSFTTWKISKVDCEVPGIFQQITASQTVRPVAPSVLNLGCINIYFFNCSFYPVFNIIFQCIAITQCKVSM